MLKIEWLDDRFKLSNLALISAMITTNGNVNAIGILQKHKLSIMFRTTEKEIKCVPHIYQLFEMFSSITIDNIDNYVGQYYFTLSITHPEEMVHFRLLYA